MDNKLHGWSWKRMQGLNIRSFCESQVSHFHKCLNICDFWFLLLLVNYPSGNNEVLSSFSLTETDKTNTVNPLLKRVLFLYEAN